AGSAGAYFAFGGDDRMRIAGGNTNFLNKLPKTTGGSLPMTMALAFRAVDETGGKSYMGSFAGSQSALRLQCTSSEVIRIQQGDGVSFANSTGRSVTPGSDYVVIFALGADGSWRHWLNSPAT